MVAGPRSGQRSKPQTCTTSCQTLCAFSSPSLFVRPRVAILVVGVLERLYPNPLFRHVVAPAASAGYDVDLYMVLSMQTGATSFRTFWYQPTANPQFLNYSKEDLELYLTRRARYFGARRVGIYTVSHHVQVDELPTHVMLNERFLGERSYVDIDTRIFTSSLTLWLALKRWKQIELLWNWTVASVGGEFYKHVVLTRSDAYWLDDLNLANFPSETTIYSRAFGTLCNVFDPRVVNDQAIIMGGKVAHVIMRTYSAFYHVRDPRLDSADSSESFMMNVAAVNRIKWTIVRQDWMPLMLALHVKNNATPEPLMCFRQVTRKHLLEPNAECIHPSKIQRPLCDELELV